METSKIIISIIGLSFLGISLYTFIVYIIYIYKSKVSLFWSITEGQIIENRKESALDGDTPSVRLVIKYKYHVEDIEYISNRIFFSSYYGLEKNKYYKKYFLGKKVMVFYNPKKHNESVLENGLKNTLHLFLIESLFILVIALLIIASVW